MKQRLVALLLVSLSTGAIGAPVELTCVRPDKPKTGPISITLNEDAGTVSLAGGGKGWSNLQALFQPNEVDFHVGDMFAWSVDRTTLVAEEIFVGTGTRDIAVTFQCRIVQPDPARKF
jgi:hypothetical protein